MLAYIPAPWILWERLVTFHSWGFQDSPMFMMAMPVSPYHWTGTHPIMAERMNGSVVDLPL